MNEFFNLFLIVCIYISQTAIPYIVFLEQKKNNICKKSICNQIQKAEII